MSNWQPIATAPKDGTPFLVCWADSDVDKVGGWEEYAEIIGLGEPPATHWMPVPAPPVTAKDPTSLARVVEAYGRRRDNEQR